MIKNLGVRLAARGKIKIGGLGEKRKSSGGKEYRLPVKYDHFVITTNVRTPEGDLSVDNDIMVLVGMAPKELDVMLYGNSIEDCYDDWYAYYDGKTALCRGDGDEATWRGDEKDARLSQLNMLRKTAEGIKVSCHGTDCPLYKDEDNKAGCKLNFILRVILLKAPAIGGVYELRSTSFNSALAMRASIKMLLEVSDGKIVGVPLKLRVSPKTVQLPAGQATIYVTHLEYPGDFLELKSRSIEHQKKIMLLDYSLVNARGYQEHEDSDPDEIEAVTKEFYPDPDLASKEEHSRLEPPKSKSEMVVEATVVSVPDASTETETISVRDANQENPHKEGQTQASQETKTVWDLKKISEVLSAAQNLSELHTVWKELTPHISKLDKDGKIECQKLKNAAMEILHG